MGQKRQTAGHQESNLVQFGNNFNDFPDKQLTEIRVAFDPDFYSLLKFL